MSVRYTDQEKLILKRANEAIADPNTSDWHRRRFEGDIRRVREAAEARAKEREKRNTVPPPPSGVHVDTWSEERRKAKEFLAKVRAHVDSCPGCPQCHGGIKSVEPGAVTAKPKDAPPAALDILAEVQSYTICASCLISTEYCSCKKTPPTVTQTADDVMERIRKRAAEDQV